MKQPLRNLESRSDKNANAIEKNFTEFIRNYDTINKTLTTIENRSHSIYYSCENRCQYLQRNRTAKKSYHSCVELLRCGFKNSGRYVVEPYSSYKKEVFCDQVTDGGGWTVFLRNRYGNISFNKGWLDYKKGFEDLDYDFWIGNEFLFKTTTLYNSHESKSTQLYITLIDKADAKFYVKYNNFAISSETTKYKLHVSGHMYGTAGDSLEYHNNLKFTTKDHDNDSYSSKNCAVIYDARGGWWYKSCYTAQLASTYKDYYNFSAHRYTPGPVWPKLHGNSLPLSGATMMFREKY